MKETKDPRRCPACGRISPPGTPQCDCGHDFDGPLVPAGSGASCGRSSAAKPQGYAFGWWFACWSLAMSTYSSPALYGFPLDLALRAWYVTLGLAASVVRPWCWYVLLMNLVALPMAGGLYIAIFVNDWQNGILVTFFVVALAVIESVYFYKRRVMSGASGRWRRLELWCPLLVGPDTCDPRSRPGFAGLSHLQRVFFLAILLGLVVLDKLEGLERAILMLVILLALLLFVRRARPSKPAVAPRTIRLSWSSIWLLDCLRTRTGAGRKRLHRATGSFTDFASPWRWAPP